jgi:hypothetical protein
LVCFTYRLVNEVALRLWYNWYSSDEKAADLKSYNGYSSAQRARAQSWLNSQWRSDALTRPIACIACGQTAQPIDAHDEDYSEPFRKDVTDAFHLCFICHMMVHSRHRNKEAWRVFRRMVEGGGRPIPLGGRRFLSFQQKFLTAQITSALFEWFEAPRRLALSEIEFSQDRTHIGSPRAMFVR